MITVYFNPFTWHFLGRNIRWTEHQQRPWNCFTFSLLLLVPTEASRGAVMIGRMKIGYSGSTIPLLISRTFIQIRELDHPAATHLNTDNLGRSNRRAAFCSDRTLWPVGTCAWWSRAHYPWHVEVKSYPCQILETLECEFQMTKLLVRALRTVVIGRDWPRLAVIGRDCPWLVV